MKERNWYNEIAGKDNLSLIPDCIDYYENELKDARKEINEMGSVERQCARIPGIVEYRFNQLQLIEAILEHLNIKYKRKKFEKFKDFFTNYDRKLSTTDAKYYAENQVEVVSIMEIINSFALIRNKYEGIIKALETKQYQLNNIVKLRTAGMEDSEINYTPAISYKDKEVYD